MSKIPVAPSQASVDMEVSRPSIDIVLRKHNLTIDDLVTCGKEGLIAYKKCYDRYGDPLDVLEPDHNVRHKFFASFMLMLGYLEKDSVNVTVTQVSQAEKELLDAYKRLPTVGRIPKKVVGIEETT